ncbi:MAG: sodium/proton-translocating pyrophosphatase, partial [Clostridia bacterium]|nr:sodium/proton-translocating pyrophosphatase [Clostridia bacterium]
MDLMILSPIGAVVALVYAFMTAKKVTSQSEGTEQMAKISASIRLGADAYLKREYSSVIKFFALVFVVLLALTLMGFMNIFEALSFL